MKRIITLGVTLVLIGGALAAARPVPAPVLGPQAYPSPDQLGFGHVKPRTIFMGGDPTGLVCRIRWLTWGGRLAVGTGTGWYITPTQSVNEGHPAPTVIVLSKLGFWHGRRAYLRYRWYFPEAGEGLPASRGCSA